MSKRPSIDLLALTSEQATPMQEATQRTPSAPATRIVKASSAGPKVKTEDLRPLAFKVPPVFRKRFKQRALVADLKLNELLVEALDAWEEKQGIKR